MALKAFLKGILYLSMVISFCASAEAESFNVDTLFSDIPFRRIHDTQIENAKFKVALAPYKKVNGRWRNDNLESLSGSSQIAVFELKRIEFDVLAKRLSVFSKVYKWEELFQCQGVACGSSYAWAKHHFNLPLLDGVDRQQNYWAWKVSELDWAVAYLVQRGNDQLYLYWQVIHLKNLDEVSLITHWQILGYAEIEAKDFKALSSSQIAALQQWLKKSPSVKYAVVGHSAISEEVTIGQSDSLKNAQQVARVVESIVPEIKHSTYGLGPLAPRKGKGARVEIIELIAP